MQNNPKIVLEHLSTNPLTRGNLVSKIGGIDTAYVYQHWGTEQEGTDPRVSWHQIMMSLCGFWCYEAEEGFLKVTTPQHILLALYYSNINVGGLSYVSYGYGYWSIMLFNILSEAKIFMTFFSNEVTKNSVDVPWIPPAEKKLKLDLLDYKSID